MQLRLLQGDAAALRRTRAYKYTLKYALKAHGNPRARPSPANTAAARCPTLTPPARTSAQNPSQPHPSRCSGLEATALAAAARLLELAALGAHKGLGVRARHAGRAKVLHRLARVLRAAQQHTVAASRRRQRQLVKRQDLAARLPSTGSTRQTPPTSLTRKIPCAVWTHALVTPQASPPDTNQHRRATP